MLGVLDYMFPSNLLEPQEADTSDGCDKCCEIGTYEEGNKHNEAQNDSVVGAAMKFPRSWGFPILVTIPSIHVPWAWFLP